MDKLLPCPLCAVRLELAPSEFGERMFRHPENDCILEDLWVADDGDDPELWNTRPTADAVEEAKEVARLRTLLRLAPAPPIHADVWDHNLYCEWYRRRCAALKEGEG